jgi:GT2 family glycosyltransferase
MNKNRLKKQKDVISVSMDCTIILLSYNSLDITDTCLEKLGVAVSHCQKVIGNKLKVIVVENGSKDGSAQMIQRKYKWVHLIALKENIGFAAGNNLAMKTVNTPYILLMNSDTYVEKDSLEKTFKQMQKKAGVCDVLASRWTQEDKIFFADAASYHSLVFRL